MRGANVGRFLIALVALALIMSMLIGVLPGPRG